MERDDNGELTGKKIVDKTSMIGTHAYGNRTYVDLDWHPKGHMESHHFEKPLRRLRKFDFIIKLGCAVRMVVDSILLHAECGPNDHR